MSHESDTCGDCHRNKATTMMGFCSNPYQMGSRSSAMYLCDECMEIARIKHTSMGKIGQCVIMPINEVSIRWHNEANSALPQEGKKRQ